MQPVKTPNVSGLSPLVALRDLLGRQGLTGLIISHADEYQNEKTHFILNIWEKFYLVKVGYNCMLKSILITLIFAFGIASIIGSDGGGGAT